MVETLWNIYEKFTNQLVDNGWRGEFNSWKETVECILGQGTTMLFEFGNGFKLQFSERENGIASLRYCLAGSDTFVDVDELEQLLHLI